MQIFTILKTFSLIIQIKLYNLWKKLKTRIKTKNFRLHPRNRIRYTRVYALTSRVVVVTVFVYHHIYAYIYTRWRCCCFRLRNIGRVFCARARLALSPALAIINIFSRSDEYSSSTASLSVRTPPYPLPFGLCRRRGHCDYRAYTTPALLEIMKDAVWNYWTV